MDAHAAVEASKSWSTLPAEILLLNASAKTIVIPEVEYRMAQSTIDIIDKCSGFVTESVEVYLHVNHEAR